MIVSGHVVCNIPCSIIYIHLQGTMSVYISCETLIDVINHWKLITTQKHIIFLRGILETSLHNKSKLPKHVWSSDNTHGTRDFLSYFIFCTYSFHHNKHNIIFSRLLTSHISSVLFMVNIIRVAYTFHRSIDYIYIIRKF